MENNEEGFSLPEVIIALFLLSAIGLGASALVKYLFFS